jgi:glycosyltransferase involved in cell wall biosynthesis
MVSIIIPCYNRADLLEKTLNSIIQQSYQNWECIIVDDGSSDNTLEVLFFYANKDSRIKFYSRPKNILKGPTGCRNYGFTLTNGDYICWFDSDDIMPVNSLKDRICLFKEYECDFVIGKVIKFDNFTNEIIDENSSKLFPISNNPAAEYLFGNFWFQTSAPIFKKSFLQKFKNHFDESLTFNDETEFYVRLLLSNPVLKYVNTVVTIRRMHENSLKSGVYSMPIADKILFDQFAYFKIWLSFKKNILFYNNDVHLFFKYYFKYWILKMKFNQKRLIFIYLHGLLYSMFENNITISRILFWRLMQKK